MIIYPKLISSWDDLYIKSEFTEEEWKATSEEALSLRFSSMIAAPLTHFSPLKEPVRLSAIKSWADLGHTILKIHRQLTEGNEAMVLTVTVLKSSV